MKQFLLGLSTLLLVTTSQLSAQTEVTFYTTKGNFVVEMYDWNMPITSGNFKSLVTSKFYDGVIFHRVINNFMIQGGDPTGTGAGGPGYTIPDEFVTGISNLQKTISMANSGPNSGGSQFFINLVDNTYLDFDKPVVNPLASAHPVFGITINNFSVVQAIGAVPTNSANKPLTNVVMDSVRITKVIPASINDLSNKLGSIEIFPNPITETSIIKIISEKKSLLLTCIDQEGKLIYNKEVNLKEGDNIYSLQEILPNNLANGNYYIGLSDGKSFLHKKIVIYH